MTINTINDSLDVPRGNKKAVGLLGQRQSENKIMKLH